MNTLSISTRTGRLSKVFEDWQLVALSHLPNGTEEPIGTREVCEYTNRSLKTDFSGREKSISRASVINFLTKLMKMGLIEGVSSIGKGGIRNNYRYITTRVTFNNELASMLLGAIIEEFPAVDLPWVLNTYHPVVFEKMLTA